MQHLSNLYGLFYGRGNRASVNHGNAGNFHVLFLTGSGALKDRHMGRLALAKVLAPGQRCFVKIPNPARFSRKIFCCGGHSLERC